MPAKYQGDPLHPPQPFTPTFVTSPAIGMGGVRKRIHAQNGATTTDSGHDSIPFPDTNNTAKGDRKQKETAQNRWQAVPISTLMLPDETQPWVWDGYAGPQVMTLFTSLWKAGKTTLLSHWLKALDGSDEYFCGQRITPCNVIMVSEEAERHWITRRDALGIKDHVSITCKPFLRSPSKTDWVIFLAKIAEQVKKESVDLVIFDSIFNLWPVQDENDAPSVRDALVPMNQIIEEQAGIMLVAHPKKGDASEGQATRGTGLLPGYVDIIMEMRRYDAEHREDTRRVLTTYSRFEETPAELVIEYNKEQPGYAAIGSKSEVKQGERISILLGLMPVPPTSYTIEEVQQSWPVQDGYIKPGERTLSRDLKYCVEQGYLKVRGDGIKGDPHRYYKP